MAVDRGSRFVRVRPIERLNNGSYEVKLAVRRVVTFENFAEGPASKLLDDFEAPF